MEAETRMLQLQEEACQGLLGARRSWKRQGVFPRASRDRQPCQHLDFDFELPEL